MSTNDKSENGLMTKEKRSPVTPYILAGGAVALGALGALAMSARRSDRTIRGKIIADLVVPALNMKRRLKDDQSVDAAITDNRKQGPALPPTSLSRYCFVTDAMELGSRVFTVAPRDGYDVTILYLHGGAYVFDLTAPHWTIIRDLACNAKARVVVPLYPLAPESDWQAAFKLATNIYDRLVGEAGADRVFISGDSAGGGFTLALAQTLRDADKPLPAGMVLFCPWADATISDPEQTKIAKRDSMLAIDGIRYCGKLWAGKLALNDPKISPLFGTLDGLPPTVMFSGTDDILYSDACRIATAAKAASMTLDFHAYPSMFHVWMAVDFPEGDRARKQATDWIKARVMSTELWE